MSVSAALRWLKKHSLLTSRAFAWTLVGAVLFASALMLTVRYGVLPNIASYKDDIAAAVSRAAKARITIGSVYGDWAGLRPRLILHDVSLYDDEGRRALTLERVDSTIAWRSLATLNLHFHTLDIYRPALHVRRDPQGGMWVAGIKLEEDDNTHSGFTAWLFEQPDIEVHDARVAWDDEWRKAPPLELSRVNVKLLNRGRRHRFAVHAIPPADLAGPLDVRGDMRGASDERVSLWNGRLFVDFEARDLSAAGIWLDVPIEIARGAGAVRTWLTFREHEIGDVIADVKLSALRTRLRENLPELDLDTISGRVGWKNLANGFEVSAGRLALAGSGVVLPPADFLLRLTTSQVGLQQGEIQAKAFNLPALVMLADRLPIQDELRTELTGYAPSGRVHDLVVRWEGTWPNWRHYSVRGRFESIAIDRYGSVPGISGLSGNVDGSEKGGTLHVSGNSAVLDMPTIFSAPLTFDTLNAQLAWSRTAGRTELRFNNVAFSNADAAGTLFGSYRMAPQSRGEIDLTAALTRADARAVPRYMPVNELKKVRPWLERAIIAGQSNDVRFRLKGKLDEYPFKDEKRGLFQIAARISNGILEYDPEWPRIENMEGDLQFRGTAMEFLAREGTITGVKVSNVSGGVADMTAHPEVLVVSGEAEGATSDFLAFIAKSPVSGMIDHFTDGMQAQGAGRLALKLTFPLGEPSGNKVAGTYTLQGNQIVFSRDLPPLEQAAGTIQFTENAVRVPGVNGQFLGGPVSVAASTQRDGSVRVAFQGRATADHVRKAGNFSWMRNVRGAADWRGVLSLRKKVPDLVIESNLQGIASSLPAPFDKASADSVPLRVERRFTGKDQDRLLIAYGDIAKANLVRHEDGKRTIVDRGIVRVGPGETGEPDRPDVWIRGSLKSFDVDDWLAFNRSEGSEGGGDSGYALGGADVRIAQVDFFGRRFNEVMISAAAQSGATQLALSGREIEGTATWHGEGKGRLIARLKKLYLPSVDGPLVAAPRAPGEKPLELPALDVAVDDFHYGAKQLGHLELNAVHVERDWRIEKLRLSSPDSALTADGVWQGWLTQPRTQLKVRLEVSDIGRTLARWNYPAGVRGGTAKIEGNLSWSGSPHDFDYPTLRGELAFDAAKGQFLKLEPGFAKLLGILSLQSLPRRVTLDFRDVFSEGLAFDSITGAVRIEKGIASTDNFRISGPSARIAMTGDVDLAQETQRLRVRVTPHLSESVSIAGALLGGPVAGVAAFLAQKMLKDPIEQLASFEYNVTGSWSDPQVAKVERAAALAPYVEGGP